MEATNLEKSEPFQKLLENNHGEVGKVAGFSLLIKCHECGHAIVVNSWENNNHCSYCGLEVITCKIEVKLTFRESSPIIVSSR